MTRRQLLRFEPRKPAAVLDAGARAGTDGRGEERVERPGLFGIPCRWRPLLEVQEAEQEQSALSSKPACHLHGVASQPPIAGRPGLGRRCFGYGSV